MMGEDEGSFRGSGFSPWGSEVGLPCSSTNVNAMQAIPAGRVQESPSAQYWVHIYNPSLQPATLHWDSHVTAWVAQCHVAGRAHRRGCSPGSRGQLCLWGARVRSMVFSTGCPQCSKNLSPAASQQLSPCPARASWVLQPHMQAESISIGPRKAFITEKSRMGLTIPVLLRDRVQMLSSSPLYAMKDLSKPVYVTPFCRLDSQSPPHHTHAQDQVPSLCIPTSRT